MHHEMCEGFGWPNLISVTACKWMTSFLIHCVHLGNGNSSAAPVGFLWGSKELMCYEDHWHTKGAQKWVISLFSPFYSCHMVWPNFKYGRKKMSQVSTSKEHSYPGSLTWFLIADRLLFCSESHRRHPRYAPLLLYLVSSRWLVGIQQLLNSN